MTVSVAALVELLQKIEPPGFVLVALDPHRMLAVEFVELMREARESVERCPCVALLAATPCHPTADATMRAWSTDLVDNYTEALGWLVDEAELSALGFNVPGFPGIGRRRLVVLAGKGRVEHDDSMVFVYPDQEGEAILDAVAGRSRGSS